MESNNRITLLIVIIMTVALAYYGHQQIALAAKSLQEVYVKAIEQASHIH
jgi:glucose-6-phosphate-specific signal transduction histidine kinase